MFPEMHPQYMRYLHIYKLMKELDKSLSIGPILMGLKYPAHILQLGASVEEIVNMAAIASINAQEKQKQKSTK